MSPSTPTGRQQDSPFSTPSPASKNASPSLLTPRSRIKALLASVDDDSDLESPPKRQEPSERRVATRASPEVSSPTKTKKDVGNDTVLEDSGSTDDDELLSRPKGRMAARMLGQDGSKVTASRSDSSDMEGNAYERIKQQLIGGVKINNTAEKEGRDKDSEDDQFQISTVGERPGKLVGKCSSKHSPQSSPIQPRQSSPGLFVSPEAPSRAIKLGTGTSDIDSDPDSDLPASPQKNSRFLALVAKKRQERVAQEEAVAQKKLEKAASHKAASSHRRKTVAKDSDADSDGEDDGGRKLTQQARPSRKASKKALEDMHRETQRMSRNMQLAHEARTRKTITKESLFERFNFRPTVTTDPAVDNRETKGVSSSSVPTTDSEALPERETPPTSPATHEGLSQKNNESREKDLDRGTNKLPAEVIPIEEEDLPSMEDILAEPIPKVDKGKGRAIEKEPELPSVPTKAKKTIFTQPPIRVRPPKQEAAKPNFGDDSDTDLEIVSELPLPTRQKKKHTVFDRLPAQKTTNTRSMQTLRALANLTSPGRDISKKKASMTPTELQTSLQKRARQQAAQERAEKLQDLRDRGIIVQTAEERERDQAEVENLVEKARREAESIMQKEKSAAKKDRKDKGESDGLENPSDEDQDWKDDEGDEAPQLSGSESGEEGADLMGVSKHMKVEGGLDIATDEEEDDDEEEEDTALDEADHKPNSLFDTEAGEDEDEDDEDDGDEEEVDEDEEDGDAEESVPMPSRRKRKVARVLSDEEDDVLDGNGPEDIVQQTVEATPSESPTLGAMFSSKPIIPGLDAFGAAPLGLTQMFDGTMADAQSQELGGVNNPDALDEGQDSLAFLRGLPAPSLPDFDDAMAGESQEIIQNSQSAISHNNEQRSQNHSTMLDIDLNYSQSQVRYNAFNDSQQLLAGTQYSEFPDPTQDVGFEISSPPLNRFAIPPPSTVDTVLLSNAEELDSPIVKKKGRLRRRNEAVTVLSDVEDDQLPALGSDDENGDLEISANAFDVMRKAATKSSRHVAAFDRKGSHAKGMVEEQAEESEDEYAGLGGASDDDSNAEDDEEVRKMINDEGGVKVDERRLAAFYADKERANDEKQVTKLFKDITNGMLRRKRGADYELSDSDDDGEARRRMKQREFAKMRKALLEDENIGKIATNPKKAAFLQAIEDRDVDEDLFFLDQPSEPSQILDSQEPPASQSEMGPPSKRKRPLEESTTNDSNRPPPALRRIQRTKKPSNLADIRESLSSLLEEPNALQPPPQSPSSSENEGLASEEEVEDISNKSNDPFSTHNNPRRRRRTNPVIDRLALTRATSTKTSSTTTRLAFLDQSTTPQHTFKIPSLLRRATTQLTNNTDSTTTTTTNTNNNSNSIGGGGTVDTERMAGFNEKESLVKRGGSKKSSINYFAREEERLKGVREGERLRGEGRMRVMKRRKGFVEGLLGGGRWE
ncbi:MAG: hypothetical protein M1812_006927 [Candelaria pacifica]|nr:MAG: hypothetical protein M1812_006927 [Candelaria pacifica]